jgi:hypothetical protein
MNYQEVNTLTHNVTPKTLTNDTQEEHVQLNMHHLTYPTTFNSTHKTGQHESSLSSNGMDSKDDTDGYVYNDSNLSLLR